MADSLEEAILDAVKSLDVVEGTMAAACRHATDENFDLRMALLELRIIKSNLAEASRLHREETR
jgi:hypothetical protein